MQQSRVGYDRKHVGHQVEKYVGGGKYQCAGLHDRDVARCHGIDHELAESLKDLSHTAGTTLFATLLATLYVLLAGYEAMIWRFSGAVERVVAAVANAHKRDAAGNLRVGVTGLPEARVHIPPRSACLRYFTQINDQKSRQMARKVEILIGRKADLITARFRAGQLGLPSGSFELEPVYRDAAPLLY